MSCAATSKSAPVYRLRRPEQTALYRVVCEHLETMLAEARSRTEHGFGYPKYVEHELRR